MTRNDMTQDVNTMRRYRGDADTARQYMTLSITSYDKRRRIQQDTSCRYLVARVTKYQVFRFDMVGQCTIDIGTGIDLSVALALVLALV